MPQQRANPYAKYAKVSPMRIDARSIFGIVSALIGVTIILLCFTYATGNTDFWWHVKAGELMRRTHAIIETDPFAWTRKGLPYLAIHGWLAQIFLSLAWDMAGTRGVIALRCTLLLACVSLPLVIDRKRVWAYAPLSVLAAIGLRAGVTDRPQLFTFVAFSAIVTCCAAYVHASSALQKRILIALPLIIGVWANMHGGAAVAGIGAMACLGLHSIIGVMNGTRSFRETKYIVFSGIAACIALFVTPEGFSAATYLANLLSDKTAAFISEWQPSTPIDFLKNTGPMLLVALLSTFCVRKHLVFSASLLVILFVLARTASRHEPLLVLGCLAVTILQCRSSEAFARAEDVAIKRPIAAAPALMLVMIGLYFYGADRSLAFSRRDDLSDIPIFAPVSGAANFLAENSIRERVFNNYNAGGELLFHDIPVFLDGRNVDYGYEYIKTAVNAGVDAKLWSKLDGQYGFSAAVIEYYLQADREPIPYTDLLDKDPTWALVYLDDWTAVYVKAAPERRALIEKHALRHITPKMFRSLTLPGEMRMRDASQLEVELLRMIRERPDGVFAHLYAAKFYAFLGHIEAAEAHVKLAKALQPSNSYVWQTDALVLLQEEKYLEAGASFERAITLSGGEGIMINYAALSGIFERANDTVKSKYYRRKALRQ